MIPSDNLDAPISLSGFFDENDDNNNDTTNGTSFEQIYEIQRNIVIGDVSLSIRQSAWHMANANKVWPGALSLAKYVMEHSDYYGSGKIVELGSATGALAIFLSSPPRFFSMVTSDIDDGGDVESNIKYNFQLNGIHPIPQHVAHTWGNEWPNNIPGASPADFKFIFASDILLYVSAYPNLVRTLVQLFYGGSVVEFLMSWNRRIAESAIFFKLMSDEGFRMEHRGSCIYSFFK